MKKIIGFVTAGLPFNGNSVNETAVGGSESAVIYMARELAALDNLVLVYCNCDKPGEYEGVCYAPLSEFYKLTTRMFDVLVVSRHLELIPPTFISNLTVFWMHDVITEEFSAYVHLADEIFLMSDYQKSLWVDKNRHYEKIIHVTSNGFDEKLALSITKHSFEDKRNNYVYASRPERGLKWLLKFIWPKILEINPDARLRICRYENPNEMPQLTKELYAEIESLMSEAVNVDEIGALSKPEFYQLLGKSAYMIYPCDFQEISCINAIEAQAMECLVICTDDFALSETVKSNTKVVTDAEYYQNIINKVKEYQDKTLYQEAVIVASKKIYEQYAWSKVASDWDAHFNSAFETRFDQYRPQIIKRLINNSDLVTCSKIDPTFDTELIPRVLRNNFARPYLMHRAEGKEDNQYTRSDLQLNSRQAHMLEFLKKHMDKVQNPITVLELGCYDGALSGTLYKRHADKIAKVIAYDGMIEALQAYHDIWEKNPQCKNIQYVLDDVCELGQHEFKADLIIVAEIMEHIVDYKKLLEDIRKQATPGALVIFSTPTGPWSSIEQKENGWDCTQDYHVHHFELADLFQIFEGHEKDNGFFLFPTSLGMVSYRNEPCSNYIFGFYNNVELPFHEYDPILKAKKTRPYFSISTCMIVRNEEDNLFRCLNSIKHISDEIIIVDTGSTDHSKEICSKYPTKIYDLKWEEEDGLGSFERARNYSIDKATGDWIFWIDADEVLYHPHMLADYTRSPLIGGVNILQKQIIVGGNSNNDQRPERLFRRGAKRFYGVLHEIPREYSYCDDEDITVTVPDLCRLNHFGYLDNEIRFAKIHRNHELLKKNIQRYPDLIDNHTYMIRDMLTFYLYSNEVSYLESALEEWKKYPPRHSTSREITFWIEAFGIMQTVYQHISERTGMKFISKQHDTETLFVRDEQEFEMVKCMSKKFQQLSSFN